jgi:DNA mismatch endonuclease (patch repair protein)
MQPPAKIVLRDDDAPVSAQRSRNMARVRGKDTKPEMIVRRLVHALGYRFRLHRRDLPGCPDLVFPSCRKVIFVHGCFWHQHRGCRKAKLPKTRRQFWETKLSGNKARDRRKIAKLRASGWRVLVIWECHLRDPVALNRTVRSYLQGTISAEASCKGGRRMQEAGMGVKPRRSSKNATRT